MKTILHNENLSLIVDENRKMLVAGGRTLIWQTLSEYSLQLQIGDQQQMVESTDPTADISLKGRWIRRYEHPWVTVEVACVLEDAIMLKTVEITAKQPLTLRYARTEIAAVGAEMTRGGEGQPVFIDEVGFIASTFPTAENRADGAVLTLRQAPFVTMEAGTRFILSPVVFGVNMGKGTAESFRQFLLSHRPHPNDKLRIYCDWGAHDELAGEDGLELCEEMACRILDDLRTAREKTGLTYDYYLMDAYWYDLDSYDRFKPTHWPDGPARFLGKLEDMGMQFGLWFDVNLQKVLEHDKKILRSNRPDELCMAARENMDRLFASVEKHVREHRVRMLKFDFAFFDCNNPEHRFHSQRKIASKEPAVRQFINRLAALRKEFPDLRVLAYNGFTTTLECIGSVDPNRIGWAISPFWALATDYLYCGDPRPAERPAPMEKSILHYSDCMMEQFVDSLMPREAVDDHGSMIGKTNTIYYLQKRSLRDSYLLNIVRGTRKIHLYGETSLLDDGDWRFLAEAQQLFDFVCAPDCRTEPVLDRPSRGTVYGYSNTCGDRGVITAVNVTAATQPIVVNINGQLRWKRIYHAGEWCDEVLPLTGYLNTELEGYGVDAYAWERIGIEDEKYYVSVPIAVQRPGGYVEADTDTAVVVTLPAGCQKVGVRFLSDQLSPLRDANEERATLRITADGGELTRLDTMTIWSGISFAVYDIRVMDDCVKLRITNTGDEQVIVHWQDLTSGKER